MSRPTPTIKVLRIAVVCSGRILTERLIDADCSVRIGTDALNDLVIPTHAFGASTVLFATTPAGYALTTLPAMHGKLTVHSEPASVRALVADGVTSLHISSEDRGKLVVDDVTVLFQFVAPPPVASHLLGGTHDFRPRLFEEDDPIFVGATAIFTGLAAVLLAWVYTAPPPPVVQFVELDSRIGRVFLQAPAEPAEPVVDIEPTAPPVPTAPQEPDIADVEEAPAETEGVLPDGRRLEDLTDDEARAEVANNPMLLRLTHGFGPNAGPALGGVLGEDDASFRDLDEALENVTGVQVADVDGDGVRRGEGLSNDDVDIDDLDGIAGGTTEITDDVVVELSGSVTPLEYVPEPGIEDPQAILDAMRAGNGRLVTCYERALKSDPTLEGRVDIEFFISAGRVTSSQVFADTTRNVAFTTCLTDAVRRIGFPANTTAEVVFPFVFSPQQQGPR